MDVHYVWIGEPCVAPVVAGSSLFHDVSGPTMLSRVWGGGPNRIHFWCLRTYAPLYRSYFENPALFPNPIIVHACEDFFDGINKFHKNLIARKKSLHWDPVLLDGLDAFCNGTAFVENLRELGSRAPEDFLTNLLVTYRDWICPGIARFMKQNMFGSTVPANLRARRRVNYKNLMSFVILHFCGGYFLDSNVFPWIGIGGANIPTNFPNINRFKTVAQRHPLGQVFINLCTINLANLTTNPSVPLPSAIVWANKGSLITLIGASFAEFAEQIGLQSRIVLGRVACIAAQDVWLMASPAFNRDALVSLSNFLFLMNIAENVLNKTHNVDEYKEACANIVTFAAAMGYSDDYVRRESEPLESADPFWDLESPDRFGSLVSTRTLGIVKYRLNTHRSREGEDAITHLMGPAAVPLALSQLIEWQTLANARAAAASAAPPRATGWSPFAAMAGLFGRGNKLSAPIPPMPTPSVAPPSMAPPRPHSSVVLDPGAVARIRVVVKKEYDTYLAEREKIRHQRALIFIFEIQDVSNGTRVVNRLIKRDGTFVTLVIDTLDISVDMAEEAIRMAIHHFIMDE